MEITFGWYKSGRRSCCWRRSQTDYDEFVALSLSPGTGSKGRIWRLLWRKIKREKKRFYGFSNPLQFSYDACDYAQNFDQGSMLNDFDDISRSFSARFAVPSTFFHRKGLTA